MKARRAARFIDPFTDFAFKKIFGSEPNKDLLIGFLNALFEGQKLITDLSYNNTEYPGSGKDSRTVIFDILCTGSRGEQFLIEMQKIGQEFFRDRCVYYTSSLICDQVRKGDKIWQYQLKEVYLIGLMDFCFDDTTPDLYIHDVRLMDKRSCRVFYERLGYIFIEIPKFNKRETDLHSTADQWLFVLKNMHRMHKIPVFLRKSVFLKLFKIAEMNNLSTEERKIYDVSLKRKWDWENSLAYARKQAETLGRSEGEKAGRIKGEQEGRIAGEKEGRETGRAEGRKEGAKEEQIRIARNFKAQGFPVSAIASATGLPVTEIEQL